MSEWSTLLTKILLVFSISVTLLHVTKTLRSKRGALSAIVNFEDLMVLAGTSLVLVACTLFIPAWMNILLLVVVGLYGVLVWLDALLFIQYRIEVNRQSLAWFLTGHEGLAKGIPHLLAGLSKSRFSMFAPFLWVATLSVLFIQSANTGLFAVLSIALLVGALCHKNLWYWCAGIIICLATIWLGLFAKPEHIDIVQNSLSVICVGLVLLLVGLYLLTKLFSTNHEFLSSPTLLTNIIADDSFNGGDTKDLLAEHQRYIAPIQVKSNPSDHFGVCNGANIILITVESMGAYIPPYLENAAKSLLAKRFQSNSWLSKQHYCLCPNTTVSTNQIYSGEYSNNPYNKLDSLFPGAEPKHLSTLKKAGYKTLFLDSADISLYDYHKLLARIGFDKVWGTRDIPSNGLKADYRLLNMIEPIVSEVGSQPFFLHLINDQTHMPYKVVDQDRFNRHQGNSQRSAYLNALEEVDFIIDSFLQRLGERIDLSNTMIVFTGDHGESFGEYGYSFHSNSVTPEQMQVPFMLSHPKLKPKQIDHSCHFDLFPTFFDLLGIEWRYQTHGRSLAHDDREFAYFFHSATLKGNSPANFGFLLDDKMVWMDRLFNQVNTLQYGQGKIKTQDKEYVKTMLYQMLKSREMLA